jgi:ribosome-associated protein
VADSFQNDRGGPNRVLSAHPIPSGFTSFGCWKRYWNIIRFVYNEAVSNRSALQFAVELAGIAHDNKCDNVVALDLRGISPVTDFVIIGTGSSDRQIRSVADCAIEYGKKISERPYGVAGYDTATWVLVDFVEVVFHVFADPFRKYYDLELLWGDAPRVEWARSESA